MANNEFLPITIERLLAMQQMPHHINFDLILTDIATLPLPEGNRRMQCIFVGLCLSGEGSYSVGGIDHKVKQNDVIIIGESQVLGGIRTSADFNGIGMFISHDFLYDTIKEMKDISNLFIFSREHPVLGLTAEESMMFKDYYSLLMSKVDSPSHAFRRNVAGTLIATMVYDLCNAAQHYLKATNTRTPRAHEVFEQFIRLVEREFRNERRVSWYSQQLGLSPKTLLELVKRVSQRTPNDWLDTYTAMEIRLLLRNTSKSMKEIAMDLSFGTQSSMGKFFKEHTGMSPSAYRSGKHE